MSEPTLSREERHMVYIEAKDRINTGQDCYMCIAIEEATSKLYEDKRYIMQRMNDFYFPAFMAEQFPEFANKITFLGRENMSESDNQDWGSWFSEQGQARVDRCCELLTKCINETK